MDKTVAKKQLATHHSILHKIAMKLDPQKFQFYTQINHKSTINQP